MDEQRFFDRDLSWLSFNYRVLLEAKNTELPLYERLKFLAIYSSNLDEFFRVRVAAIRSILKLKKKKRKKWGIIGPGKLLRQIHEEVFQQQEEFGEIFRGDILPKLAEHQVRLLDGLPENLTQQEYIEKFFLDEVLPFVHPVLLLKNKIAHFLRDRALYLAVKMKAVSRQTEAGTQLKKTRYAIVQIPTHYFSRFIQLPRADQGYDIMFLDDIVRANLHLIFPGFTIEECASIKLSRDADLLVEDQMGGKDLADKIQRNLAKRQVGAPARFLYDKAMSPDMLKYLRQTFKLKKADVIPGGRYHNFNDFFAFPNPHAPRLEQQPLPQLVHPRLDQHLFEAIGKENHIIHFPYQTYDHVLRFLNDAALDPQVTEINTTQYRVASDSAIVRALINAANSGKKVSVFVEIKARFDEASNLRSAREMADAGIKVMFSLSEWKVHAKVALVKRMEEGQERAYAFLSTGNFNEKTARIYADHGLMTADPAITGELGQLFDFLEKASQRQHKPEEIAALKEQYHFRKLLVAQFNIRSRFFELIDREIAHARAGKRAHIWVKLNNLEHQPTIEKLYEASQAGVRIDLIIRGICCLRPGLKGVSERITVTRIVDRYLEHARVFLFYNEGAYDLYLGSADWMTRNLERRVEVVFPLEDEAIKREVMHTLLLQLKDNVKAVRLDQDIENVPVTPRPEAPVQAQLATYRLIEAGKLGDMAPEDLFVLNEELALPSGGGSPA